MGMIFYLSTGTWSCRNPHPLPQGSLFSHHTAVLVRDTLTSVGTAKMVGYRREIWALQPKNINAT